MPKEKRKIEKKDLLSLETYEKNRKEIRKKLIEFKKTEEYQLDRMQLFILKVLKLCLGKFKRCYI